MEQVKKNLEKNGFDVEILSNKEAVKEALLKEIPTDAVVGFGGSVTLKDTGIYQALTERGNKTLWHWETEPEKRGAVCKEALFSDVYLSSANALLEEGEILNIDGNGNRVSALFYGPKKVILVIGKNKIVGDYEAGLERIRTIASPMNARRLNRKTPCATLNRCTDCDSPDRMCMVTSLIEKKPPTMAYKIYLVDEELGY
jgi:L-lactate utilization protein LutC